MTTWKVLLLLAVLALPLGYVVADVGEGVEEPAPRPAIVLPVGTTDSTSTPPGRGTRSGDPIPSPSVSPSPARPDLCADDRDDDRGDDDDGIDVVRPCPDDFGEDDDGEDPDDADDRDED